MCISVIGPPKIKCYKPHWWQVKTRTNVDAYIKVETWGYPYPNYTWFRKVEGLLARGPHYDGGSFSVLKIPSVNRSDFGRYDVKIRNYLGWSWT